MRSRIIILAVLVFVPFGFGAAVEAGVYGGGSGTAEDPYEIRDVNHIIQFSQSPGHWDEHFKLLFDINMAEDIYGDFDMIGRSVLIRPWGIEIDSEDGKMYWVDTIPYCIYRADTDGGNMETVISEDGIRPISIDLDVVGRKIYWGDTTNKRIQRANFDGSNIETVISVGVNYPYGIALDSSGGRIYWSERGDGQIKRANIDGTNQTVIASGLTSPWEIEVDDDNGYVYCADDIDDKIVRCNLDGGWVQTVVSGLRAVKGIALDVGGGKIYWTQYKGVFRANLDGTEPESLAVSSNYEYMIALEFPGPGVYWTTASFEKINKLGVSPNNWLIKNWFDGVFDGNNNEISNLTLTLDTTSGVGFFSKIYEDGECRNLVLRNPTITAPTSFRVGSLAGSCQGDLFECASVGGFVHGDRNVGGLVGRGGGNMSNSYSSSSVTGNEDVGGLVGYSESVLFNCYCSGIVTGEYNVGGLVGQHHDLYSDYRACFWDSDVNPDLDGIGDGSDPRVRGLPTILMQTESTFTNAGWDFVTPIWTIDDGNDYPRLWGEMNLTQLEMELMPVTLSCTSSGDFVEAHFVLPVGYLPEDIDINSPAVAEPVGVTSEVIEVLDAGDSYKVVAVFDKEAFCETLGSEEEKYIEVTVWGVFADGAGFFGTDTIKLVSDHWQHREEYSGEK